MITQHTIIKTGKNFFICYGHKEIMFSMKETTSLNWQGVFRFAGTHLKLFYTGPGLRLDHCSRI